MQFILVFLLSLALISCSSNIDNSGTTNKEATSNTEEKKVIDGEWVDEKDYLLYIPHTENPKQFLPLVVIFSPDGNAQQTLTYWKSIADKKKVILLGSKTYKNGNYTDKQMNSLRKQNADVISMVRNKYRVNKSKIILAGLSGGGSFSHSLNINKYGFYKYLIVNVGRIWDQDFSQSKKLFKQARFANRKVVFLASPTDFRYKEMQRDNDLLKRLGWQTKWIEFPGGHTMAPKENYEEALDWIILN